MITATASDAGFLDVFVDLNRDGDWNDASEHVCAGCPLAAGPNRVPLFLATVDAGRSFARFRFSSTGSSTAFDLTPDGEVEDYEVTLHNNEVRWHNSLSPLDINVDGTVVLQDVVLIVNESLQREHSHAQTARLYDEVRSPYFFDADDDGLVTLHDAVQVINFIASNSPALRKGASR